MSQIFDRNRMFAVKHLPGSSRLASSGACSPAAATTRLRFGLFFGFWLVVSACEPAALDRTCNALDPWSCGETGTVCGQTPFGGRCVAWSCGDGAQEAPEECDGIDGVSCASYIGGDGNFSCGTDCRWDYSGCTRCGNGTLNGIEECDGERLADGFSCETLGYSGGHLTCLATCRISARTCLP